MVINKYRDLCRKLIRECRHPELTPARKNVLLALVDAINPKEGYTAWPAFDTLAEIAGVDRRTAIRAVNVGRKVEAGILQRIYKGGRTWRGGTSNRYRFCIDPVSGETLGQGNNLVSGETPNLVSVQSEPSVWRDTRSSYYHLKETLSPAPPSSSLDNSDVVVSDNHQEEDSEKRLGEKTEVSPTTSGTPITERAEMPKQADAELQIEMAARGMDMAQSKLRRRRAVEVYSAPPVPDERPITIGQALIDQIKKKGAAA